MTYHEGQEVEVSYRRSIGRSYSTRWHKAKIVGRHGEKYLVQFADGTTADFDAEHIRAAYDGPVGYFDEVTGRRSDPFCIGKA